MLFYELFKVVNRRLALLNASFILVATAIEAAGPLNQFTPLALLADGSYASALSPSQLQALAYLPGDLASVDYTLHTVFFGLDILVFAYLVLRSALLPRSTALVDDSQHQVSGRYRAVVPVLRMEPAPLQR